MNDKEIDAIKTEIRRVETKRDMEVSQSIIDFLDGYLSGLKWCLNNL